MALLNAALQRRGPALSGVRIAALANDTVGTWATAAFADPAASIGIILGTGSNACYVEDMVRVPKWAGPPVRSGKMIISESLPLCPSRALTRTPQTSSGARSTAGRRRRCR